MSRSSCSGLEARSEGQQGRERRSGERPAVEHCTPDDTRQKIEAQIAALESTARTLDAMIERKPTSTDLRLRGDIASRLIAAYERLRRLPAVVPDSEDWLQSYRQKPA